MAIEERLGENGGSATLSGSSDTDYFIYAGRRDLQRNSTICFDQENLLETDATLIHILCTSLTPRIIALRGSLLKGLQLEPTLYIEDLKKRAFSTSRTHIEYIPSIVYERSCLVSELRN